MSLSKRKMTVEEEQRLVDEFLIKNFRAECQRLENSKQGYAPFHSCLLILDDTSESAQYRLHKLTQTLDEEIQREGFHIEGSKDAERELRERPESYLGFLGGIAVGRERTRDELIASTVENIQSHVNTKQILQELKNALDPQLFITKQITDEITPYLANLQKEFTSLERTVQKQMEAELKKNFAQYKEQQVGDESKADETAFVFQYEGKVYRFNFDALVNKIKFPEKEDYFILLKKLEMLSKMSGAMEVRGRSPSEKIAQINQLMAQREVADALKKRRRVGTLTSLANSMQSMMRKEPLKSKGEELLERLKDILSSPLAVKLLNANRAEAKP